ncbi:MAG: hypothetical protein HN813_13790 [Rhodospirillaceae bacterium]|nr:hypothetical protein [Rhodospirillaceae bacterium]MBT7363043.1 hypothetical protein [Rhodospirillaceae bacterium]
MVETVAKGTAQMMLEGILIGRILARMTLAFVAISMAGILLLAATSDAHAHSAQKSVTDPGSQATAWRLVPGANQKQQEESPTCHHGTVPCSSSFSIISGDSNSFRRTGSAASFSVRYGPPSASFLQIEPPPPKQKDSQIVRADFLSKFSLPSV